MKNDTLYAGCVYMDCEEGKADFSCTAYPVTGERDMKVDVSLWTSRHTSDNYIADIPLDRVIKVTDNLSVYYSFDREACERFVKDTVSDMKRRTEEEYRMKMSLLDRTRICYCHYEETEEEKEK